MENSTAKPSLEYNIANKLVFHKIKQALGIENCDVFYTAGAPLNGDIKDFFSSIDLMIREVYGASESGVLGICSYPDIRMKVILPHKFEMVREIVFLEFSYDIV